ncbi:hypothetical protein FA95DRAFT_1582714 [Auriscalpium vulgare]|uniref:Uncharacterized protein n=1 Tax=Auriscalpium vulgare TaxID=40419 RepID=A0ACB8RTC0_9AGAM|nr:hypothetical protein FA95DRAFT_1582714 [Auriscalpium vulgare]
MLATRSILSAATQINDLAIPLKPTWSVDKLLSSYPRPTIPSPTLERLHRLSSLRPPETGTKEHQLLSGELEDLVKLVEAVKIADVGAAEPALGNELVPDGRIWPDHAGIELGERSAGEVPAETLESQQLLSHATRTENGLYSITSGRRSHR